MRTLKITLAIIMMPFLGYCWNAQGHGTGGAIAYYYLKSNNPAVLEKVLITLQAHPWYNTVWAEKTAGMTTDQKNVTLFMLASTFPDEEKNNVKYGGRVRDQWHYINYGFVPEGQHAKALPPKAPNAELRIKELLTTFSSETPADAKAVDLCWIFHLIEDVHQPLHTIAMYDDSLLKGDQGGNLRLIRFDGEKPIKLHFYWDGLVNKNGNLRNLPASAEKLYKDPKYSISNLPELKEHKDVHEWIYDESFVLAKTVAYQNGKINGTLNAPTQVDNSYAQECQKVAEKRIVLAGIRLGMEFEQLYK